MKPGQFRARLVPKYGGSFSQLHLSGCVPTAIPPRLAKHLIEILTLWSGWPVVLALPAAGVTAGWCDLWVDCLRDISVDHLEIRFLLPRRAARGRTGKIHEP
jgi:hypothetical protein